MLTSLPGLSLLVASRGNWHLGARQIGSRTIHDDDRKSSRNVNVILIDIFVKEMHQSNPMDKRVGHAGVFIDERYKMSSAAALEPRDIYIDVESIC